MAPGCAPGHSPARCCRLPLPRRCELASPGCSYRWPAVVTPSWRRGIGGRALRMLRGGGADCRGASHESTDEVVWLRNRVRATALWWSAFGVLRSVRLRGPRPGGERLAPLQPAAEPAGSNTHVQRGPGLHRILWGAGHDGRATEPCLRGHRASGACAPWTRPAAPRRCAVKQPSSGRKPRRLPRAPTSRPAPGVSRAMETCEHTCLLAATA